MRSRTKAITMSAVMSPGPRPDDVAAGFVHGTKCPKFRAEKHSDGHRQPFSENFPTGTVSGPTQARFAPHRRTRITLWTPVTPPASLRSPLPPCPHCGGNLFHSRNAECVIISCLACGRYADEQYRPSRAGHRIQLPERATAATMPPKPRPKSNRS